MAIEGSNLTSPPFCVLSERQVKIIQSSLLVSPPRRAGAEGHSYADGAFSARAASAKIANGSATVSSLLGDIS